jgi:hypothetical protein
MDCVSRKKNTKGNVWREQQRTQNWDNEKRILVGNPGSRGEIENEGRFGLKSLVGDPRTRIELSMEDTLDFRAFGSTPKYMN